jgi:hypothetical protein
MLVPKYGYTNVHIKINASSEQIQNDTVRILKNPVSTTNLSNDTSKKNKKKIINTISDGLEVVTDFFMGCDTNYITPQLYQFTGQLEVNYWHDYYRLTSVTTSNSMTIESSHPLIIGGYICWGIFGYGHYININDINTSGKETYGTSQRSSFTVNTSKLAAEIYTFHSGEDAKITSYADCNLSNQDNRFSGLKSKCFGLNAEYIFNNKKYSWPAAFGINAVQRKSKGSWKLGISYNHQRISFDKTKLPNHLKDIDPTLLFRNVDYKDYAISFGYGYNWVFKKNCLFAISCLPSIGYRKSDIEIYDNSNSILKNISTDVITRMSLYWNNTRFFSGLLFELHTYSYRENRFALTNSYGTLKYILGINFVKKKQ